MLGPRLTHRHPHVDETGREAEPAHIHPLDILGHAPGEQRRPEVGDPRILGEERPRLIQPARRIQQPGIDVGDTANHRRSPAKCHNQPRL